MSAVNEVCEARARWCFCWQVHSSWINEVRGHPCAWRHFFHLLVQSVKWRNGKKQTRCSAKTGTRITWYLLYFLFPVYIWSSLLISCVLLMVSPWCPWSHCNSCTKRCSIYLRTGALPAIKLYWSTTQSEMTLFILSVVPLWHLNWATAHLQWDLCPSKRGLVTHLSMNLARWWFSEWVLRFMAEYEAVQSDMLASLTHLIKQGLWSILMQPHHLFWNQLCKFWQADLLTCNH